ncbi:MAG: hypothetical protein ACE5ID_08525, partial [Acidobacteriota bacterium]
MAPDMQTVSIRERNGSVSTYQAFLGTPADGALIERRDRNGNFMQFFTNVHGQVTSAMDPMGRRITYAYDPAGHLREILDFHLRATQLAFNAQDQLVAVTMPAVFGTPVDDDGISFNGAAANDFPSGKTYMFRYDSGNPDPNLRDNLLGITFPNEAATGGPERIHFTYGTNPADPSTYDRVLTMEVGAPSTVDPTGGIIDVPAGGTYTFSYQDLAPRAAGDLTTEIRRTTVTDPNGNLTEYFFNSQFNLVRRVALTNRNINPADPAQFVTLKEWNSDSLLTQVTQPEGNRISYQYDSGSANRFSQGNLLRLIETPDPVRGGDQSQITTTYTYEPIYNMVRTITSGRGNDPAFVPPLPDNPALVRPLDLNLDGDASDPADSETTRVLRYTSLNTYDYQEGTAADITALAAAQGVDLDMDGPGPLTAAAVAGALSLGGAAPQDLNEDGTTAQQGGNLIERARPVVALPDGSTPQAILTTCTFNQFGQMTSCADGEGILHSYYYFPEDDPDGDGGSAGLLRPADPQTGGYLMAGIHDDDPMQAGQALRLLGDPVHPSVQQPIFNIGATRRNRPAPFVAEKNRYTYDPVGNATSRTDGRGITTTQTYNALNQIVETVRAAAHDPAGIDPPEPDPLIDFGYRTRYTYDFNNNIIRRQVEDRGNTSSVGGDNPGPALVDTLYTYDVLDQVILEREEVSDTEDLITLYRYDPNGHQVLTIRPEGNAVSSLYDERDLLFQETRGALVPPPLVLLAPADPAAYDVRGGAPSTSSYTYDGNENIIETADAADTDGSAANNSALPGAGDRTRNIYDGYDRWTSSVDSLGNQTVVQYDPDDNVTRTSRFGPTGGPSPASDGPHPPLRPVSAGGVLQTANLASSSLLDGGEHLYDEIDRVFQEDRVLFI